MTLGLAMALWSGGCASPAPEALPPPAAVPADASEDPGPTGATRVKPADRDPARWSTARCNDGTPFAYAIRPGDRDLYVINISGGYFCEDDRARCADRAPRLVTSPPEPDGAPTRIKSRGVFSRDPTVNPTFARATQVDAHYCSSDLWLGASTERQPTTGDPARGWYFSGRVNFRALLDALSAVNGLDEADPALRVLFVGTSAGGAGLVGNVDQIVAVWPHAVADGRVKLVLDGSWVPPVPPWASRPLPDASRWGAAEPGCDAARRARGEPPRNCVLGVAWWPYVAKTGIPVLVQISGLDTSQTPVFGVEGDEQERLWRDNVRASLDSAGVPWVYSVGEPYHVVAIEDRFAKGPPGEAFRDVLAAFWAGEPARRVFLRYP